MEKELMSWDFDDFTEDFVANRGGLGVATVGKELYTLHEVSIQAFHTNILLKIYIRVE